MRLALVALALTGCSWTFDGDQPSFPLLGSPPLAQDLVALNDGPVYVYAIVQGVDGHPWISLQEDEKSIHVKSLFDNTVQTIAGDEFILRYYDFYVWVYGETPSDPTMPRDDKLHIIAAGQTTAANEFDFPNGAGALIVGGNEVAMAYAPSTSQATVDHYTLLRTDHSFQRDVPFPDVDDPQSLGGMFFSDDGRFFFDRARCTVGCAPASDLSNDDTGGTERRLLTGHSTTTNTDYPLGLQPRRLLLYEPYVAGTQFITCGSNGLNVVPVVPSVANPARVLDEAPCASEFFQYLPVTNADGSTTLYLYYQIGEELRRVPVDGSLPPQKAFDRDVVRVLGIEANQTVVYSTETDDKFIFGVGDGWIGDWKFANRGRLFYLSADNKKMRWLENAAQGGGIGELRSAPLNGQPTNLALNVYDYGELSDGRLIAASNHAYRGTQNRVVVIDDTHKEARWVADRADDYNFIPGSTDLVVDIVTGASTSDLVRVPIPPDPYATDGGTN